MFATLAVLPAVLAWLGDRVEKGRIPFSRRQRGAVKESRFWGSIVTRVMRRPVVSIVVAGGLLVALAIPALGMNVVQTGSDDLPRDIPVMKTYDRYTAAFPAEANAVGRRRGRRRPQRRGRQRRSTSWSARPRPPRR